MYYNKKGIQLKISYTRMHGLSFSKCIMGSSMTADNKDLELSHQTAFLLNSMLGNRFQ